jgi:carbon-monoxide dehydrogenase large subunit
LLLSFYGFPFGIESMTTRTLRREDARLLTGRGRYTADWNLPGQLHAYVLRADRAHAEILSIDVQAAAAREGVHLVLTGEDLAAAGKRDDSAGRGCV